MLTAVKMASRGLIDKRVNSDLSQKLCTKYFNWIIYAKASKCNKENVSGFQLDLIRRDFGLSP